MRFKDIERLATHPSYNTDKRLVTSSHSLDLVEYRTGSVYVTCAPCNPLVQVNPITLTIRGSE
jgi:hypothetical protein